MSIPPQRSFAIFVAIDAYSEAKRGMAPNLRAAKKDAKAMGDVLVDICQFAPENVWVLFDEKAQKPNIEAMLSKLAKKLEAEPGPARLWLQFSGHGLAAAGQDAFDTMFATFDTDIDDPSRTALSWRRIVELVPTWLDEVVVVLDFCHASNIPNLGLRTDSAKPARRAVLAAAHNGQAAYELKDGTNSMLTKALLEAFQGQGQVLLKDRHELHLADVLGYVSKRVPDLIEKDYGLKVEFPPPFGQLIGWVIGQPGEPWPRPLPLPTLLAGFDTAVPPPLTLDAWRCVVVTSTAEKATEGRLKQCVHDALLSSRNDARKAGCELDMEPVAIDATDALASDEQMTQVLRALCRFPIAVFDVTNFDPGVMFLLGIRSMVRRGITICTHGGAYVIGDALEFPFNFREVSFASHSANQKSPPPVKLLRDRLLAGITEICDRPHYYLDLPGFDAVRRPQSPPKRVKPSIFFLCPFNESYKRRWTYVEDALKAAFKDQDELDTEYEVVRMTHVTSPRLVTQTLYEQIRRAPFCVVDLSSWRPNVLLELGVRLAVCPDGADCIIDTDSYPDAKRQDHLNVQKLCLVERLRPQRYEPQSPYEPLRVVAERNFGPRASTPWFDAIAQWIDPRVEIPSSRPDQELRAAARILESEEPTRKGISSSPYPTDDLKKMAATAALERRIGAWLYLDGRFGVERLAPRDDHPSNGTPTRALAHEYLELAALILQDPDRIGNPDLVARIRERKQELEAALQEVGS